MLKHRRISVFDGDQDVKNPISCQTYEVSTLSTALGGASCWFTGFFTKKRKKVPVMLGAIDYDLGIPY